MDGGWRCASAYKQQTHLLSCARWPTQSESAAGWAPVSHEASVTGGAGGGRASAMPARESGGLWSASLGEKARALAGCRYLRERATGHASASLIPIDGLDP